MSADILPTDDDALPTASDRPPRTAIVITALLAAVPLFIAMQARVAVELADDGAFFLRYAENAAHGHLWVWNVGDAPIWGSSAPLYPMLVAVPILLGAPAKAALVWTGLMLALAALTASAVMLSRKFGAMAGIGFVLFCSLDTTLMYHCGSGLETPLTIALLAAAVWSLLYDAPEWAIGAISGLLLIHKIDLIPFALLLLLAHTLRARRIPRRAVGVASALGGTWYLFAWWYFGAPVPNSFLTKALHQNDFHSSLTWRWFSDLVLLSSTHRWLVVFGVVALVAGLWSRAPLTVFLGGGLAAHLLLYTVKYPFEPYTWYAMPAVFCLTMGAAIGVGLLTRWLARATPRAPWLSFVVVALVLVGTVGRHLATERVHTWRAKRSISLYEFDRAEAGRWTAAHTPASFRVFTEWGNPAVYSHRYVYDGSFLNMKYEEGNLIQKYRPEIIIFERNPGSTPEAPVFAIDTTGYRIVFISDRTVRAGGDDFFAVLARNDVVSQITGVAEP